MINYIKITVSFYQVVLGLAGGGGQQVGVGLEDGADGLGRDAFFLCLDAECGDQRGQL